MAEHQDFALQRQLRNLKFAAGTRVRIKGTSIFGEVIEVIKDPQRIEWEFGSHPKFLLIDFDGRKALYNPSKLRRIGSHYPKGKPANE